MELKNIKSNIKSAIKAGESEGLFNEVYGDDNISNTMSSTLATMRKRGKDLKLAPKVGDLVFFTQHRQGIYSGKSLVGIVTSVAKQTFSYITEGQLKPIKGQYNFGADRGYVLLGFIGVADEPKIKD